MADNPETSLHHDDVTIEGTPPEIPRPVGDPLEPTDPAEDHSETSTTAGDVPGPSQLAADHKNTPADHQGAPGLPGDQSTKPGPSDGIPDTAETVGASQGATASSDCQREIKEHLNRNRVYLIQNLQAGPIIDYLQSRALINTDISDDLEAKKSNPREQVLSVCELARRSSRLYEAFLEGLRATNQHAVAEKFCPMESLAAVASGRSRLLSEVRDRHHLLIDNLTFYGNFLSRLEGRRVITTAQVDELMTIPARRDKVGRLLRLIMKGETAERTRGLISALQETDQPHLARLVEEGDDSDILPKDVKESIPKTQWYEWIREAIKSHSLLWVLNKLVEDNIITSAQNDTIHAVIDPEEQCRQLVDIILCRPQSIVRLIGQGTTEVGFSIPPLGTGQWPHQGGDPLPSTSSAVTPEKGSRAFHQKSPHVAELSASASVSSMDSSTPSSPDVRGRTTNSEANNLKDHILEIFNDLPSACMKPIEIANKLGLKSAKDVNPTLYEMQKNGLLDKCGETSPLWMLATNENLMGGVDSTKEKTVSNASIRSSRRSSDDTKCSQSENKVESRILQVLTKNPSSSLKSKDIAKLIGLETAKDVNPTLYKMNQKGLIDNDQGEPPAWKQADHQTGVRDLGISLGRVRLRSDASGAGNQYPLDSPFHREYDCIEELGSGRFGDVFKATHKLTGTQYAVKRIKLENSERAKKKAVKEVKALEKMDHPNIVRYFTAWIEGPDISDTESDTTSSTASSQTRGSTEGDKDPILFDKGRRSESSDDLEIVFEELCGAGVEPRQESELDSTKDTFVLPGRSPEDFEDSSPPSDSVCLYIQMELCQKKTLADWLLDNPEKDRKKMLSNFRQIVDAVHHIHSLNLIHRDLKPSNIFFSMDDGLWKIGDFGLVTAEEHSSSCGEGDKKVVKHTQGAGTRYYKSPEQCSGNDYSQKVDIYALGVIFVEIMSSFSTETERRIQLEKLNSSKTDFLKQFHKDYPTGRSFVAPLLADNPRDRPKAEAVLTNPLLCPKPKVAKQYLSH